MKESLFETIEEIEEIDFMIDDISGLKDSMLKMKETKVNKVINWAKKANDEAVRDALRLIPSAHQKTLLSIIEKAVSSERMKLIWPDILKSK